MTDYQHQHLNTNHWKNETECVPERVRTVLGRSLKDTGLIILISRGSRRRSSYLKWGCIEFSLILWDCHLVQKMCKHLCEC